MTRLLLPLAVALLAAPQGTNGTTESTETPPPSVLERVGVIGASVSDGFGLRREADRGIDFGEVLDAVILGEGSRIQVESSMFFFASPEKRGAKQVEETLAFDPTLVVGIDFLFWYAYGNAPSPAERAERFELGLELLAKLDCPLVVSDVPDMAPALEAPFPMLVPSQVPSPEEIAALNARLAAWAEERGVVVVVPLGDYARRAHADEPVSFRGNVIEGSRAALLQADLLHPTVRGTAGLAVLAMDLLERAREDLEPDAFEWDVERIERGLLPSSDAPR